MYKFIFICLLIIFCEYIHGFNIDEKNAFILQGSVDSYFGYSVAIVKNKWILVGAPTGSDPTMPTIDKPGGVFRCSVPVDGGVCNQLHIDNKTGIDSVYFDGGTRLFNHGREGQWLGGNIQVPNNLESNNAIVTCAHRWYNMYAANEWYMNGLCYLIPQDFTQENIEKLPILVRISKQTVSIPDVKTIYNWGMAGYGMSIHYTQQDNHLLFGAPGLLDWSGGLIDLETKRAKIMDSDVNNVLDDTAGDLAGYALTSGQYFFVGDIDYAMGIPRSDLIGEVKLFKEGEIKYSLQNFSLSIPGKDAKGQMLPMNSYFGASLCTADVNNDGLDDLLVGAPMYSPNSTSGYGFGTDVGVVFLYIGTENKTDFAIPKESFFGMKTPNAHFGTSIASLGDISKDGYIDIAIGSPYEDDMRGAVYVYNGYSGGLWSVYSQRVAASSISMILKGFGISITKATDINSDQINDIVIGSYLSDTAVVLYGQPVISLTAKMDIYNTKLQPQLSISYIELNASSAGVKVCFQYKYRACPKIDLSLTISLDKGKTNRERLVFLDNNLPRLTERVIVFQSDHVCYKNERLSVKSTNDLVTPIQIEAEYNIEKIDCSGTAVSPAIERFNGNSPGDPNLLLKQTVEFKRDCPDNKCDTDLHVQAEAIYNNVDGYFVIGTSNINVDIQITKSGDPSYGSVFYLVFPHYLGYRNVQQTQGDEDVGCSLFTGTIKANTTLSSQGSANDDSVPESLLKLSNAGGINVTENESVLVCNFGNPMTNDSGVHVKALMAMPVYVTEKMLKMTVLATTQSHEINEIDNTKIITVQMRHHVTVALSGVAPLEEIFIREARKTYTFEHRYELGNQGPSSLPTAVVTVHIPEVRTDNNALLWLNKTKAKCSYPCKVNCVIKGTVNPIIKSMDINGQTTQLAISDPNTQTPTNAQRLDCTKTSAACAKLICSLSGISPDSSAVLYMEFQADRAIEHLIQNRNPLPIVSKAEARIDDTTVIVNHTSFSSKLMTTIMPRAPTKKEVEWWVILLSVLGGIFFIAILVLILFKIGFFKRKTRDELQQRRIAETNGGQKNGKYNDKRDSYTDSEDGIIDKEENPEKSAH